MSGSTSRTLSKAERARQEIELVLWLRPDMVLKDEVYMHDKVNKAYIEIGVGEYKIQEQIRNVSHIFSFCGSNFSR